jgi:hypothetical protein
VSTQPHLVGVAAWPGRVSWESRLRATLPPGWRPVCTFLGASQPAPVDAKTALVGICPAERLRALVVSVLSVRGQVALAQ